MKDYKPSPDEVRSLRELRGQSQEQAARSINYTYLSWRQWERGKADMPACAWAVYRLGGLRMADALDSSDKLGVRQAITAVFELPKLPQAMTHTPREMCKTTIEQEPTGVAEWAVSINGGPVYDHDGARVYTLLAFWGSDGYGLLLERAHAENAECFPVYDDVQDWIVGDRQRRAFADHFGFDYLEEV